MRRSPRSFSGEDLDRLSRLHAEIDGRAAEVARRVAGSLACRRGCCDCCQDGLTVLEIEAALILANRDGWSDPLSGPAAPGGCPFLAADGSCRTYRWRPYICRTQGLPLRWLTQEPPGEGRSICPLNDGRTAPSGVNLDELAAGSMWTLGEWEGRLASLQAEASGEFALVRIPLRDLW
ncbi:MAG: YkgJ family cysteine cluster protein [Candidatus Krumholzibacteriia bacterium]